MFARHKHKTRGSITMYRAAAVDFVDSLRSLSRDDGQNFWIHETWDGAIHDGNRFRAFLSDEEARRTSTYLKRFSQTFYPNSSMAELQFLKMSGGAPDQLPRREFMPVVPGPECLDVCSVPGLLFLALQDGTYLYGYGWNNHVPLRSNQQIIELNKGDVVMLRGDYIFARAGSEATNVCVQGYIDTPLYVRPEYQVPEIMNILDDTRDADEVFCFVWQCPFIASSKQALSRHLNNFHGFHFNQPRDNMP